MITVRCLAAIPHPPEMVATDLIESGKRYCVVKRGTTPSLAVMVVQVVLLVYGGCGEICYDLSMKPTILVVILVLGMMVKEVDELMSL